MTSTLQLNFTSTIKLDGAEISDFDPKSKRLFVTGEAAGKPVLQVIDAADPKQLTKITNIDLSSIGSTVQSVAIRKKIGNTNSIVAVAIAGNTNTDNGKIAFFDATTLTKLAEVQVGALPDMITFTADGSKLLVANEGEPNEDYSIDPEGSISIIDVSGNIASLNSSNVTTANFTAFNSQETTLKSQGVRIFGKLKNNQNSTVAQDVEPEYIAISPDGKTAFITLQENNALAVLDIPTATITKIIPLGYKNHNLSGNGLDASDRDVNGTSAGGGKINIKNWPIFGMYQPDGISSFQIAGKTYYITANEGDARIRPTANNTFGSEGSLFNEESRVSILNLDPTTFPNATDLKRPENLGRLTVTNKLGDTDGDGDFDQLYAFGGRSFSIWDEQGKLVFDSGDQLEQITQQKIPKLFNANSAGASEFDTRSDNKGPEPEGVVIGIIDGRTYGFIGLERTAGGVMVYDITNPTAPTFVQYIFIEGDIAPEGLKFIAAEDSPNGKPLLAVTNEVSNTVSFYEIGQTKLTTYDFTELPKLGTNSTNQDIFLGGFSGLYFQGIAANGNWKFVTHTDRGPNGDANGQNRPFFLPDFQPEIVSFELNRSTNQITITQRTKLFRADGTTPLTGLPNIQAGIAGTGYTDEIPVNLAGQTLPNDSFGADLEGIVVAQNGDYWMVDEYRPAIYQFNTNGKLLNRFISVGTAAAANQTVGTFGTEILPAVYAQRRNNRGFEAVALEGYKLYAFIQTPLDNPDNSSDTISRSSRNIRILEFDISTQKVTGEYLYILDDITGSGNAKTDKIGDAVSLGNGKFAVVERDDRSDKTANKLIYEIDLKQATNINNPANLTTIPTGKTIEQSTIAELTTAQIIPVKKRLITNAANLDYTGVEKLEGLALVAPDTLAIINDNDFNVAGTNIPSRLGIIKLPYDLKPADYLDGNIDHNVFTIKGQQNKVRLKVTLTEYNSNLVNEFGVFVVDNAQGKINGIAPGENGYQAAAFERVKNQGQVILSAISNLPNGFSVSNISRLIEFDSNMHLKFYLVQNNTTDSFRISSNINHINMLFADVSTQKISYSEDNSINLAWKDGSGRNADFKDLVVKIKSSSETLALGTTLQGNNEGEVIDLRQISGLVKADFSVYREATFNNEVYFYKVDNAQGGIAGLQTNSTSPSNYLQAAINNLIKDAQTGEIIKFSVNNQGINRRSAIIAGGSILAPMIVVNGTLSELTDNNPNNDPQVYFPYLGVNGDKTDHIRVLGDNIFGFEDLPNSGDKDYNDVIISAKLTVI
ncbi:MAG: choice-of-anchor I family protein [Cuspidothrix sp.]